MQDSERARALEQARKTALRTDATYLSPSGRIVRVQGHKLTGRILLDSRGRVAVRNIDTDRLSYVHEADLRELAVDPPPSGVGPQAETPIQTLCNNCMKSERFIAPDGSTLCHYCGFVQPAPVSPVEPTPEPPTDQLRETPMGHRIFRHVCGTPEDDGECMACSQIDCPDGEPLHYHHDGCPCCSQKPTGAPAPCVWREGEHSKWPTCRAGSLGGKPKFCHYCGAPLKVER